MRANLQWELATIVGDDNLLTSPDDRIAYDQDWRGVLDGQSFGVVRPSSAQEVSEIVQLCTRHGIPLVPQGGNTGMCGGATPDNSSEQLIVSMTRMRAIREIDTNSNCIIAEAGLTLSEAQAAAADANLFMPLSIASEGSATIGGVISTNAGGVNVLRYGNTRDLTLGIEAVLPDGSIWSDLVKLHKNNTGYDLKHLFIGGEGTLGIVTAACMKLVYAPVSRVTFLLGIGSIATALSMLRELHKSSGDVVESWELFSDFSMELLTRHCAHIDNPLQRRHPWYLLGELALFDDNDDAWIERLAELADRARCDDVVLASSHLQRQNLWAVREGISEAERCQGRGIKHDVAVPTGLMAELITSIEQQFDERFHGCSINIFGHVGDGNLHVNAVPRVAGGDIAPETAANISDFIYDETCKRGGSFSAEHGVGSMKTTLMSRYKQEPAIAMMRQIKNRLDPTGIFNPGKLFK